MVDSRNKRIPRQKTAVRNVLLIIFFFFLGTRLVTATEE